MTRGRSARPSTGGRSSRAAGSTPTGSTRRCSTTRPARTLHLGVGDEMTLKFIRRTTFDRQIVSFLAGLPDRVAGTGTEGAIDRAPLPRRAGGDVPHRRDRHRPGDVPADPRTARAVPPAHPRVHRALREADLTGNNVLFVDLADVTDLESFRSDVARLGGGASVFFGLTQADHEANVNRTLHLAAVVLWLLAGLIALGRAPRVDPGPVAPGVLRVVRSSGAARAGHDPRSSASRPASCARPSIALLATVVALVVAIALLAAVADRPGARRRAVTRRRGERRGHRHRHARGVPRRAARRRADHVALDPTVVAAPPPRHRDPPAARHPPASAAASAPAARGPRHPPGARRGTRPYRGAGAHDGDGGRARGRHPHHRAHLRFEPRPPARHARASTGGRGTRRSVGAASPTSAPP